MFRNLWLAVCRMFIREGENWATNGQRQPREAVEAQLLFANCLGSGIRQPQAAKSDRLLGSLLGTLSLVLVGFSVFAGVTTADGAAAAQGKITSDAVEEPQQYQRTTHPYRIPQVVLTDSHRREVDFASEIDGEEATIISFIFTTCAGICPVITSNMSRAVPELDKISTNYRVFLVSLDPEYDTPERLSDYASRFKATKKISFLTGSLDEVHEVLRAFNAVYLGGRKMNHLPVTLIRANRHQNWVRLDGLVESSDVVRELALALGAEQQRNL